jgi:hypothetical protein
MTESGATPAVENHDDDGDTGDTGDKGDTRDTGDDGEDSAPEPSWWHRSHPTFAGLVGFFSGVAYVIVVPGVFAALLRLVLGDSTAQRLFPLLAFLLIIPLALLVPRKTRRFAMFMLLGVVTTALVIGLTAALVIWVMVQIDG